MRRHRGATNRGPGSVLRKTTRQGGLLRILMRRDKDEVRRELILEGSVYRGRGL
jgi:hypothetical protein